MSMLLSATLSQQMSQMSLSSSEHPFQSAHRQMSSSAPSFKLPHLFEKQRMEEQGGLVKTKGVDDLMGNVTAFMYSDLKDGLASIKDPDVQTRTLLQARMVLGSVNTMMPDPEAPNSMLPPPLDNIWLALPSGMRPNVEEVRKAVTHEAERGV